MAASPSTYLSRTNLHCSPALLITLQMSSISASLWITNVPHFTFSFPLESLKLPLSVKSHTLLSEVFHDLQSGGESAQQWLYFDILIQTKFPLMKTNRRGSVFWTCLDFYVYLQERARTLLTFYVLILLCCWQTIPSMNNCQKHKSLSSLNRGMQRA